MCQITVRSPSGRFRTPLRLIYLGVDECQITVRCGVASLEPTERWLQGRETSIVLRDSDNAAESSLNRSEIFLTLMESPGGLGVNGADVPRQADRWFSLRELRMEVTGPQTPLAARHAVRASLPRPRESDTWNAAAVRMATLVLRHRAAALAPVYRGDIADLDAEALPGFIDVFVGLPAGVRGVGALLVLGGHRAGLVQAASYRSSAMDLPVLAVLTPWPWMEAQRLLAQATGREATIPEDAHLLQVNRLQGVKLAQPSASVPSPSGGDARAPSGGPSPKGSERAPEQDTAWTAAARLVIDQADTAALRVAAGQYTSALEAGRDLRPALVGGGQ